MLLAAQLGSPLAAEEPNVDQLAAIAGYLENNEVEQLRAFLQFNPELMEGETPLAVLLRDFMAESGNLTTYLGFRSQIRGAINNNVSDGGGNFFASPSSDQGFEPAAGSLY